MDATHRGRPDTRGALPSIGNIRGRIGHLPRGLVEHVERVAEIAVEMAGRFGVDGEKVQTAALLHDVARATRGPELLRLARKLGIAVSPIEERMPILVHGPVGAELVRRDLGVQDEEVLEAIRCHTVGGPGLGAVGRVLYLADKLDPCKDSKYPFNARVRELARDDLDGAILEFITCEASAHLARGDFVHPATMELRSELLLKLRKDRG